MCLSHSLLVDYDIASVGRATELDFGRSRGSSVGRLRTDYVDVTASTKAWDHHEGVEDQSVSQSVSQSLSGLTTIHEPFHIALAARFASLDTVDSLHRTITWLIPVRHTTTPTHSLPLRYRRKPTPHSPSLLSTSTMEPRLISFIFPSIPFHFGSISHPSRSSLIKPLSISSSQLSHGVRQLGQMGGRSSTDRRSMA